MMLAPLLTITNAADGTGGTATISGGDELATNVLSYQTLLSGSGWTLVGSLSGSGTLEIALAPGVYLFKVESSLELESITSNIVSLALTDAGSSKSVHKSLLRAVRNRIAELIAEGLITGVAADSVVDRDFPRVDDFGRVIGSGVAHVWPAIVVSLPPTPERLRPGMNLYEVKGYPVSIAIVDGPLETGVDVDGDPYLWLRQVIADEFRSDYFTTPAQEFHDCDEEPGPVFDWAKMLGEGKFVSAFNLRFWTNKTRGNN